MIVFDERSRTLNALVEELERVCYLSWALPEDWIICTDSDVLRYVPKMAERRSLLRKAKAELTRRRIQERVDEISEAWEDDDQIMIDVLVAAFPKDLEVYGKLLSNSQRQWWIDKARLAACGKANEASLREPLIYFVSEEGDDTRVKIGHTTNLPSRLSSLRTASAGELRLHLVIPGTRDDEKALHRMFAKSRLRREWFTRSPQIDEFIAMRRANANNDAPS
ncbi:MAG TPA: GIY-YIG nuclease family protein [Pseudolabrys sp.]|nr:GIY-YIG nuclease family protein [Pseudolabrys sp.]